MEDKQRAAGCKTVSDSLINSAIYTVRTFKRFSLSNQNLMSGIKQMNSRPPLYSKDKIYSIWRYSKDSQKRSVPPYENETSVHTAIQTSNRGGQSVLMAGWMSPDQMSDGRILNVKRLETKQVPNKSKKFQTAALQTSGCYSYCHPVMQSSPIDMFFWGDYKS